MTDAESVGLIGMAVVSMAIIALLLGVMMALSGGKPDPHDSGPWDDYGDD